MMRHWYLPLLLGALGCAQDNGHLRLKELLRQTVPAPQQQPQAVMYLREAGCMSCNRSFAELIAQYVGDQRVLLVIDGTGAQVDLSPFLADSGNVLFDHAGRFHRALDQPASCALFLNAAGTDTTIVLDARSLPEQLAVIGARLGSP